MVTQAEYLRASAVHEAAHAVVGAHFGLPVQEVRVDLKGGKTICAGGTPRQRAAISAAGEVGQRLAIPQYIEMSCADLTDFERRHGLGSLWQAQRDARAILTARRPAVLALADRLERERVVRF